MFFENAFHSHAVTLKNKTITRFNCHAYFSVIFCKTTRYCNNHVAPTEIEDILQTHPAIAESLVFGIKEPKVQELISAVVVLKDNFVDAIKEEDIIEFVNSRVDANFKQIRGPILFRKSVPRNTFGKLLRRELRKWAEEEGKMKMLS